MGNHEKKNMPILQDGAIEKMLTAKGLSRRDFMKFCGLMAATLGLEASMAPRIAAAIASTPRPPIVWLQFAECTGCTEALLRTSNPFIDDLLLDKVTSEYHETIMAAAGDAATDCLNNAVATHAGQFFCFVEGAIPTAANGIYGTIGGRTMLEIAQEVCPQAKKVVCIGTCASYGGLPAAAGGLTGAKGVKDATGIATINMPGCPPNPVNLAALVVNYLLENSFPPLDAAGRPTFAYGSYVHMLCPRLGTDRCLYGLGCRGPSTAHNCPTARYNGGTSWCVQADSNCRNCTAPGFFDMGSFFNHNGTASTDLTPPEITVDAPADNSNTDESSIGISGRVDEMVQGIAVSVNNGPLQAATVQGAEFSATVGLVLNASNSIRITATDLAGNASTVTRTVLSDTLAPSLAVTEPAQDIRTAMKNITVRGTASSVNGAVMVSVTVGGRSYAPQVQNGSFSQEISFSGDNVWPITVSATDGTGKRSEVTRIVICSTPDLNDDGKVDIADALQALRMSVGLTEQPAGAALFRGDVAPMLNGMPAPDGRIDVGDALVILRHAVGLTSW